MYAVQYCQTIRMKDTEGAKATLLLRPTGDETTELLVWKEPTVSNLALCCTLMHAAYMLCDDIDFQALIGPAWATVFDRCTHTGTHTVVEGVVIPADDHPF